MNTDYNQLEYRIRSLYQTFKEVQPADLSKFAPTFIKAPGFVFLGQDFRGGLDEVQIREKINRLLFHIAHLRDLVKGEMKKRGADPKVVDDTVKQSRDIQICIDLADRDKHGGERRHGGLSKLDPRLGEVGRVLQIATGAKRGAVAGVTYAWHAGRPVLKELGGRNRVVFEGDVIDRHGNRVGDVMDIAERAVQAWERLLRVTGIRRADGQ